MVAALLVVTTFLFGRTAGVATAAAVGALIVARWYGIALSAWIVER